jgi:4-hydroxy-4-methyl-2-oxoglutarate aldolase
VLLHPGDNWMLHVVAEQIQPGDIVVAAIASPDTDGSFGDLLGHLFQGARRARPGHRCRRAATCTTSPRCGFPVWSRAISAKGTIKATLGSVNIPVVCAGMLVNPGDAIVADDDGVVVGAMPRDARKVADAAAGARGQRRRQARQARRRRAAGLDMYKLREPLEGGPQARDSTEHRRSTTEGAGTHEPVANHWRR